MKTCSKCKVERPLDEFYARKGVRDGKASICGKCLTKAAAAWNKANPDKALAHTRKWAQKNRDVIYTAAREWRRENRERFSAARSAWVKAHPAQRNAKQSKRRAAKLRATPAWANSFFIAEAYDLAQRRTKATGFEWHVDHIVPLRSKLVCGLHVEHNLQVIPATQNCEKSNIVWPDMPMETRV